jgi:fermentation-respiration switch protein FrsA (DUF1100 family)
LVRLAVGYIGIIVVLLALENRFLYHPLPSQDSWIDSPDPAVRDVYFDLPTGERVHAWWWPRPGSDRVTIYCHGNAGNLSHRGGGLARWADVIDGSVLIFDYPGYGRSTGVPTEKNCYAAGEAAWNWLATEQHVASGRILLVGASLGGAMATELAREHGCQALVLIKAFTSVPDMAQVMFPWLPARYFVRHKYDNVSRLPQIHRPVFIAHGTADTVVPYRLGERLFAAANQPKEFLPLPGDDHNDKLPDELFMRLRAFLASHPAE